MVAEQERLSSVLTHRDANVVANVFESVFLSGANVSPLLHRVVPFIIDNAIARAPLSFQWKIFMKECTSSLNKKFPVDEVGPKNPKKLWTPKYLLGAAFTLIQYQRMLVDSSTCHFLSVEEFANKYSDDDLFLGADEAEMSLLASFRNFMVAFFRTVKTPNEKKEMVLFIAGAFSVGSMTKYTMGSGQKTLTDRREAIYHRESGCPMKQRPPRKQNSEVQSSSTESVLKTSKRKIFQLDPPSSHGEKKTKVRAFPDLSPCPLSELAPACVSTCPGLTFASFPGASSSATLSCKVDIQQATVNQPFDMLCVGCRPPSISVACDPPAAFSSYTDLTTTESPPRMPDGATFSAYAMDEDNNSLSSHGSAFSPPFPDTVPEWENMPIFDGDFDDFPSLAPLGTL